jgi:hypothetical protein
VTWVSYYYIASPNGFPVTPQLRCLNSEKERNDHSKEIYNEIKQSYLKQGKEVHRLGYTQTGFTFTITSRKLSGNNLSDYVYASVKESLEEILRKL